MSEFTDIFDKLLETSSITQYQLAEKIGISPAHLSDVKRGTRNPTPEFLECVITIFELNKKQATELHEATARDRGFKV